MYASLTMGCISLFFIEHKHNTKFVIKKRKNMISSGFFLNSREFDLALN